LKRWFLTALSFAVVIGASVYAVRSGASQGFTLRIPWQAHLLAFLAFAAEIVARTFKLTLSAKAVRVRLPFTTAMRTSLGGDFGASITPARMGAEPARYLILAEAGIPAADAMVILYTEIFFEAISMAVVVFGIAVLFHASGSARLAMAGVIGMYALFVTGISVIGVLMARRATTDEPAWARRFRLHGKRWDRIQKWFGRVRSTAEAFKSMRLGWGALSLVASIIHIAVRFTVLPAIIYSSTTAPVPLAPLVVWPLGIIYGAGVVPAPGGGGAVELTFRAALDGAIPRALFAAALVWWRFYTFYIYIIVGGLVAGNTALRAVREAEDVEEEFEREIVDG
jgi:uncharacterized protein (TIRG00374 family)